MGSWEIGKLGRQEKQKSKITKAQRVISGITNKPILLNFLTT